MIDRTSLLAYLPQERVGAVVAIEPLTLGQSGAGVYAVTTSRGACVLRLAPRANDADLLGGECERQLRIQRRAADAGIAPAILHVDEAARAVVCRRVAGMPLTAALADAAQRGRVLAAIVEQLRAVHGLDASGVEARDPVACARAAWQVVRQRPGFPLWATGLGATFDEIAAALAVDPRSVVSHNDLNPGNIVWDGARAWLVDWDVAGLAHPHYDLATLALFLRLDDAAAFELAAHHDRAELDARGRAVFLALRRIAALACGLSFLALVEDLRVREAQTAARAPTLLEVYSGLRDGTLDLQTPLGRTSMGLALLAAGV